jgi:hypothetical protein
LFEYEGRAHYTQCLIHAKVHLMNSARDKR